MGLVLLLQIPSVITLRKLRHTSIKSRVEGNVDRKFRQGFGCEKPTRASEFSPLNAMVAK